MGALLGAAAAGALALLLVEVTSPVEVTVDEAAGVPAGAASVDVVSVVAVTVSVAPASVVEVASVVAVTVSLVVACAVEVVSVVVVTASVGVVLPVEVVAAVEVTDSVLVTALLAAGASVAAAATVAVGGTAVGTAVAVGGTGVGVGSLRPHAAISRQSADRDTRMPIDLRMVEPFFLLIHAKDFDETQKSPLRQHSAVLGEKR